MRALRFNATAGAHLREDQPIPKDLPDEEVLIRVLRAGICSTDLEILRGMGLMKRCKCDECDSSRVYRGLAGDHLRHRTYLLQDMFLALITPLATSLLA
jgi:hypothetical protein